jgi:PBP1b-binding outer membrane lipoprotein LpoB
MRVRYILAGILALALLLSACQSKSAGEATGGESSSAGAYPPPAPTETLYVYPSTNETVVEGTAYPGSGQVSELEWGVAVGLLASGQVKQVLTQGAPNLVFLLFDGRSVNVVEPSEGAFKTILEQCAEQCKNIEVK